MRERETVSKNTNRERAIRRGYERERESDMGKREREGVHRPLMFGEEVMRKGKRTSLSYSKKLIILFYSQI